MQLVVLSLLIGAVIGDSAYKPSGWRPTGPSFHSHDNRLRSNGYDDRTATSYGAPNVYPSVSSAADVDRIKTTQTTTTSIPRSREPITPFNIDDDVDLQINPAVAIANSFAFNKPVYVYNGIFPLHSGFTFVK